MNGKQAKRLRRAALGLAATIEETGQKVEKDGYTLEKRYQHDRSIFESKVPRDWPVPTMVESVTIHVDATTVKGIYKKFKKGIRS